MNRLITSVCVIAIIFSAPAYSGKATRAAVLGFIGGYAVGKYTSKPSNPPPPRYSRYRSPRYVASPMEQAFRGQSRFIRRQLQARLQEKGFYYSYIDGFWGPGTRNAFDSFASSSGNTHMLTSYSGANELMRMLLSPEEVEQITYTEEISDASATDQVGDVQAAPANSAEDPAVLQRKLKIADDQLALLNEVLKVEMAQGGQDMFGQDKINAIKARISLIESFKGESVASSSATADATNLPVSMPGQKVAGIYPLIPYYTPGSGQVGELEVAPRATGNGVVYDFRFVQHVNGASDTGNTISINSVDISQLNYGIQKSHEWSGEAQKKGLRQLYQKVASCFPENMCGDDNSDSSTKVLFMLYEDGSTAAKVQRKSGDSMFGYNLSLDSALLLASYLDYMKAKGETEYGVGTMTDADLNSVFK